MKSAYFDRNQKVLPRICYPNSIFFIFILLFYGLMAGWNTL